MINKKLFAVVSLATTIATSSAFAKTEGNYVGVDALATQYKVQNANDTRNDNIHYGVGVNYKYAFNMDNIFVAPGIFYNFNDAENRAKGSDYKSEMKYSYGVKADLGYDITDKFAAFVTLGYQEARLDASQPSVVYYKDATTESIIYGLGAKYSVTNNIDVALAYEYNNYTKSGTANAYNPELMKLGVAYKF